jgi:hypothetical protein
MDLFASPRVKPVRSATFLTTSGFFIATPPYKQLRKTIKRCKNNQYIELWTTFTLYITYATIFVKGKINKRSCYFNAKKENQAVWLGLVVIPACS